MDYNYREAMRLVNQLCFPLYAAARNVTGLYTPWLKPLGLTYTQYIVLLVLWERDGVSVSEIGEKLMLDNGTLSPLLKKLEQAGEKAKDIPLKVAGCVDLPPEKAAMLYTLLYELLENRKNKNVKGENKDEDRL